MRRQGYVCHWCNCKVYDVQEGFPQQDDATIDHVVPVSKGGGNTLTNLVLACRCCNEARGNLSASVAA